MMYKPLPDYITIKESPISGLGLFATEKIDAHTLIGIIHHPRKESEDGHIRTPLGGFGNHSDTPNCFKVHKLDKNSITEWWLVAERDIESGEELTWCYTLYSVNNEEKT